MRIPTEPKTKRRLKSGKFDQCALPVRKAPTWYYFEPEKPARKPRTARPN
jgi:hypothetical protein